MLLCFAGSVYAPLSTTKVGGPGLFGGALIGTVQDRIVAITGSTERPLLGEITRCRGWTSSRPTEADGVAIDVPIAAGARGLVLEAMGAGNAGIPVVDAVRRACTAGVNVVVTTRVPTAGHLQPTDPATTW